MFLTVLIILGIVIAGGFLIYFVADIVMSLANKDKDKNVIAQKQERERKELEDSIETLENKEELKQDPEIRELIYRGAEVEAYNPYEEETVEEVEEEEEPSKEEEEDKKALDEEIARRKQALMERLAILQKQEEEEEIEEETQEETQEVEETQTAEEEEEPQEEIEEETEEEEEMVEEVEEQTQPEETGIVEIVTYENSQENPNLLASTYTRDELLTKLAEEQERLKINEKDLRASKKEFIPLRRVKKTLEKDENKLRRKEALVAKQEVLLHGVNNYSDIDEEKAKKLAEDLDLLDGLKLSVQHCQEVMEKNKERYPLLEKIYTLLANQNAEIKKNIKNLQEAIASLDNKDED